MTTKTKQFLLIGAGVLFGLVLLLVAGALFYLQTDHAHRFILAKVNESIPGTITVEELDVSLLKGEIELGKTALRDPFDKDCAGFERLFIDFSCAPLLLGNLNIRAIVLEKPWAEVQVNDQGQVNLLAAISSAGPEDQENVQEEKDSVLPNMVFESVEIMQGSFHYETADPELRASGEQIDLTAAANLSQRSGKLAFNTGKIDLNSPDTAARIDSFNLAATLKEGRIDPLVWEVRSPESEIVLSGHVDKLFDGPLLDLKLDVVTSLSELQQGIGLQQSLAGQATAHVVAKGPLDNPDVDLRLQAEKGTLLDRQIEGASVICRLKDRIVFLEKAEVNVASGAIKATGEANLQQAFSKGFLAPERDIEAISYEALVEAADLAIGQLLAGNGDVTGTGSGSFSLKGRGVSPRTLRAETAVEISVHQVKARSVAEPIAINLKAEGGLEGGVATLRVLEGEGGGSKIESNGHFDLSSQEVSGKLLVDAPDLSRTLPAVGVREAQGSLKIEAHVSGSVKRPVFDCALQGDQIRFQDIILGDLRLTADLDPSGVLQLSELTLNNQGSSIAGTGSLHLFKKSFELKVTGDPILLEDFTDQFKGRLLLTAHLEGSTKEPRGAVELQGENLDLGVQKVHELKLQSKLDGEKIWLSPLEVALVPDQFLEANGWLSTESAFEMAITSKGIALQNIDKLREAGLAEGVMKIDVAARGTIEDPRVEGEIAFSEVQVMGEAMDDFGLDLKVHDQAAHITAKLNFDLNGSYHLRTKDFSGTILFQETDLAPYLKLAQRPDLNGVLTGKVDIAGNAANPERTEGSVQLSKLDLFLKEKEVIHAENVEAFFKDDVLSISDLRMRLLTEGQIDVKGQGKRNGPLAFDVKADLPLSVASLFVKDLDDAEGSLVLSGTVGGTQARPEVVGELVMTEVGLTVPTLMQKLHHVNGRVEFSRERVTIHGIDGQLDSGRFDLSGTVDLDAFEPAAVDLAFNASTLPLQVPDTADFLVDATLRARGDRTKSVVDGEILILEGTYYRDVNLSLLDAVRQKTREEQTRTEEIDDPFLKNMTFDISVKARNPLMVQNNLAELEINPDLRITGKSNQPVVRGRAEVESGTVTYQKKDFVVKRGVVDFLNPYETEATLDIESEVKVRQWDITLAVSGTPDDLNFKLSSNPPEEDGDILSLLVIGQTTGELIDGEGGSSASTSQMLAQAMASSLTDDIKGVTGLDILEVEAGEGDDAEQVRVTTGKELSKRIVVKHDVESKNGEIIQRAITEYKLLQNLSVSGFQDNRGVFGGQLKFRLEFR